VSHEGQNVENAVKGVGVRKWEIFSMILTAWSMKSAKS